MAKDTINGIEQGRAKFAFERVSRAAGGGHATEYKRYAKNLPALIKVNGLAAAMAFAYSKSSGGGSEAKAYKALLEDSREWLKNNDIVPGGNDPDAFIESLVSLDSGEYRHATREIMALFNWLRRFAEGRIAKG